MVLQMAPLQATVWGFVGQGAAVTVTFNGQSIKAQASTWLNQSTWLAKLPATKGLITAQGAQEFNITATSNGTTITLANVVFGDVWVCSGQSNMAYPLGVHPTCWNASNINCTAPRVHGYVDAQCSYGCVQNAGQEIKDMANYPNIRLYQNLDGNRGPEHSGGSLVPLAESSNSGWLTSDKFQNGGFSAMCWFFGRDLYTSLSASGKMRPIGLIETNVGGTPDQHWSSQDALDACKNLPGNPPWQWPSNFTDSWLWNGKVVPLLRNTIKGAVWMQGESNSNVDGRQYNCSFPAMISDWRSKWSEGTDGATNASFPFGWSQLNSNGAATKWVAGGSTPASKPDPTDPLGVWASGFPSIRLAESNTLSLPNTFQAVLLDTPVASGSVHSPYKQAAGDRLARGALATAYGVAQPSPIVTSVNVSGNTAVITIGGVAGGATVMTRATLGFEALGTDNTWHTVAITSSGGASGDEVVVGGLPAGAKAMRYLWTSAPCGQAYGNLEPYVCPIYVQAPLLQNPPLSGQFDFLPLGPFYVEL
jgi:sialate O-acetylesterase